MKQRGWRHRQGGFSASEVVIGAFVLSLFVAGIGWTFDWMAGSLAARRANNPILNPNLNNKVQEVHPGEEFGSFVVTFDL